VYRQFTLRQGRLCVGGSPGTRSLRGRKYPYCKNATAVHYSVLFRCVVPTMRLKRTENCPRCATFSLRVFLPRRLLARISHQDHGSRRRTKPACLTRWTSPHLIFESTKDFTQSAIHKVIPLLRKILCGSKSRRDHLVPW
jgi:hypothetical protein